MHATRLSAMRRQPIGYSTPTATRPARAQRCPPLAGMRSPSLAGVRRWTGFAAATNRADRVRLLAASSRRPRRSSRAADHGSDRLVNVSARLSLVAGFARPPSEMSSLCRSRSIRLAVERSKTELTPLSGSSQPRSRTGTKSATGESCGVNCSGYSLGSRTESAFVLYGSNSIMSSTAQRNQLQKLIVFRRSWPAAAKS